MVTTLNIGGLLNEAQRIGMPTDFILYVRARVPMTTHKGNSRNYLPSSLAFWRDWEIQLNKDEYSLIASAKVTDNRPEGQAVNALYHECFHAYTILRLRQNNNRILRMIWSELVRTYHGYRETKSDPELAALEATAMYVGDRAQAHWEAAALLDFAEKAVNKQGKELHGEQLARSLKLVRDSYNAEMRNNKYGYIERGKRLKTPIPPALRNFCDSWTKGAFRGPTIEQAPFLGPKLAELTKRTGYVRRRIPMQ